MPKMDSFDGKRKTSVREHERKTQSGNTTTVRKHDRELKKVEVEFKNPLDNKTDIMLMNQKTINYYKTPSGKGFSPYKKITVLDDEYYDKEADYNRGYEFIESLLERGGIDLQNPEIYKEVYDSLIDAGFDENTALRVKEQFSEEYNRDEILNMAVDDEFKNRIESISGKVSEDTINKIKDYLNEGDTESADDILIDVETGNFDLVKINPYDYTEAFELADILTDSHEARNREDLKEQLLQRGYDKFTVNDVMKGIKFDEMVSMPEPLEDLDKSQIEDRLKMLKEKYPEIRKRDFHVINKELDKNYITTAQDLLRDMEEFYTDKPDLDKNITWLFLEEPDKDAFRHNIRTVFEPKGVEVEKNYLDNKTILKLSENISMEIDPVSEEFTIMDRKNTNRFLEFGKFETYRDLINAYNRNAPKKNQIKYKE